MDKTKETVKECELNACHCSEDDNCGCNFPNNIEDYCNCTPENNCGCLELDKSTKTYIKKESVCICSPTECDCKIERTQTDK